MFPFAVGATTILFEERSTADAIFGHIERHRPTILTSVPTMINQMCQAPGAENRDLASLRLCLSAGEALPVELYNRWTGMYGVEILDGIGSAELFHIYVSNRPGEVMPGSLGKLVPGYDARIVGPDGSDVPDGGVGTLWVKGDSAALLYWLSHEKSKEVLRGDWVVTGDLFRRDADGYFWYSGRADDMLKVGGIWVSPYEVEDCILTHPSVKECAVVGVEDDAGLVVPRAFVVLRDGRHGSHALAEELKDHVRTRLAPHKYPRLVEFLEALPRNDRGKVERKALRRHPARG
jgi:acyl-coenzyme A synthetase/AMP-(fatty) acid ligase